MENSTVYFTKIISNSIYPMKFYVGGRDNSVTMQGVSICVRMPNVTDIRTSTNVVLLQISEILMRQLNEYFHSYVLDEDVSVWGRGWHCSHLSPMKRYRHVLVSLQTAHSCWISSVRGVLKPHSLMSMIWLFLISQVLVISFWSCLYLTGVSLMMNMSNLTIAGPLWRESTSHWWIPFTKGHYCRKGFHIMMKLFRQWKCCILP